MKTRTLLLATAALLAVATAPAHACLPTPVGDLFKYKDGRFAEVVKSDTMTCDLKICVRIVGSTQPCHWVREEKGEMVGVTWIIANGTVQPPQP
jgi:hypothetical protein